MSAKPLIGENLLYQHQIKYDKNNYNKLIDKWLVSISAIYIIHLYSLSKQLLEKVKGFGIYRPLNRGKGHPLYHLKLMRDSVAHLYEIPGNRDISEDLNIVVTPQEAELILSYTLKIFYDGFKSKLDEYLRLNGQSGEIAQFKLPVLEFNPPSEQNIATFMEYWKSMNYNQMNDSKI